MTEQELEAQMMSWAAFDSPTSRDYSFDSYISLKDMSWEETAKWLSVNIKEKLSIQNQWQTPACTMFSWIHVVNANNIVEDSLFWVNRKQIDAAQKWLAFCAERKDYISWSSIQTNADWLKKNNLISWYVTIKRWLPLEESIPQMKKALDMWYFIATGSASGNWNRIKQTWIYEERTDGYFVWHARCIVWYEEDNFRAVNSYWPQRWKYNGMFKVPFNQVKYLYSKLILLDFNDKNIFDKLQEVEKVKQALGLLRDIYRLADIPVKKYLESLQLWKKFSELYNTTI